MSKWLVLAVLPIEKSPRKKQREQPFDRRIGVGGGKDDNSSRFQGPKAAAQEFNRLFHVLQNLTRMNRIHRALAHGLGQVHDVADDKAGVIFGERNVFLQIESDDLAVSQERIWHVRAPNIKYAVSTYTKSGHPLQTISFVSHGMTVVSFNKRVPIHWYGRRLPAMLAASTRAGVG